MSHQSDLIATDINAYLKQHESKQLLRFITCGSVDDGKSTLIGRLLYDSKMIYEDQLSQLEAESKLVGTTGGKFDPALLDPQENKNIAENAKHSELIQSLAKQLKAGWNSPQTQTPPGK